MKQSEDPLVPIVPEEQLHPLFKVLGERSHAPAREMIRAIFSEMPNRDGNFVKDFQTTGFNGRLWELYVFAAGRCAAFDVTRPYENPHFHFRGDLMGAWVEATTANPSATRPAPSASDRDFEREHHHDVPISLGSALYSKLKARYWERTHVQGQPLVFAVADFHNTDVMRDTSAPLREYLYGSRDASIFGADGNLLVKVSPVVEHRVGSKVIPSGFFGGPDGQHVSAVMFNNSGTLTKFNRIGFELAPHLYPDLWMLRWGMCVDFDPNAPVPQPFMYEVGEEGKPPEHWCEGMIVFHNPVAAVPLPRGFFANRYGQHFQEGGRDRTFLRSFHPYWSITHVVGGTPGAAAKEEMKARTRYILSELHEEASRVMRTRMIFGGTT